MLWPEKVEFEIGENESFYDRKKDKLYFCRWQEDPVYQEEIVIRAYPTGEILEVFPGSWITMPDGKIWVLQYAARRIRVKIPITSLLYESKKIDGFHFTFSPKCGMLL